MFDLIHLPPGADSPAYLRELRLQDLERLSLDELRRPAVLAAKPTLQPAAKFLAALAAGETQKFETL